MQAANYAPDIVAPANAPIAELLSELYAAVSRVHAHANDDGARAALHDLMVQLSRFADVVAESGLNGLQNVQARLAERLLPFAEHDRLPAEFVAALEDWLQLNFHYLADPSDSARWTPLIDFLSRAIWGDPLTNGQAGILNRFFELNSLTRADSHLTTSESAPPLINANAAAIISETLDAIAGGELHPPEGEASFAMSFDVDDFSLVKELHPPDGEDSFATEPEAEPVAIEVAAEGSAEFAPPSLDVPSDAGELITLIRDELVASEPTLQDLLQTASIASLAGEQPSLEDYRWQVERLSSAASAVGLHGLHDVLSHVWDSTRVAEGGAVHEFSHQCEILGRWPALAMKYLERVGDLAISQALLDFTSELSCGLPLDATAAEALLNSLRNPALETAGSEKVARPTQATEACVALSVPEDINPALLDSMLHELPAQTQEFSTALQRIASGAGGIEELRVAQRIAHTLKGSANTVGIRGVAELSHHLEDILAALQEREILPPKRLARVLVDAADCLEGMSESLTGAASAPSQALEVLQEVLDWANKIDREGLVEDSADDAAHAAVIRPPVTLDSVTAQNAGPPLAEIQRTESSAAPMLRVATTHIDDLLRLSGESKIVGGQLKEGLRRVDLQLLAVHRQNQLFQQLVNELEQLVDVRGITMPTVRRRDSEFDALEMDQYSELHTVSRRLAEVAMDSREWSAAAQNELGSLEDLLLSQGRQSNEMQGSILKMRMVPATTIVSRLQRGVRQTSRLLEKEVELVVKGADTLIDSESLNQLVDPLMHLIRNAVDHGIEAGEQRIASGKSSTGHLTIEFGREGNQIVVRCSDDGRGLDYAAIRTIAESRGLISRATPLHDAQLGRLIMEPGFSTRTDVTQVSGRGIGLDVVNSRVLELKGTFDVQSESGRGCRFVIRLPATLISAHALLVRHGKHTVAIASRGVRQILDAYAGKTTLLGDHLSLQVGVEVYDAFMLETLLGRPIERAEGERAQRPALLIEISADRICAVLVQSVVDTIDLVVKPLGPFVPRSVGLVGATILGDGSVAPVMDMPELLRGGIREQWSLRTTNDGQVSNRKKEPQVGVRPPSVLVVDDSLSVRRSMEQLLQDAGFDVSLARDGLEAVAVLESKRPDLLLVDLEMPRMNGMELTAHVRNRESTRDLPVIMITSRSTEKHRKQAAAVGVDHYMTKPCAEDALLEHLHACLRRGR